MIDLDILVILDRSGSMQQAAPDHEGGLRSFVEDQRSLPGNVRFTLVQFDSTEPCEIVYDRVLLDAVTDIRLVPRGGTPLYEGIGRAVAHLQDRQRAEPSDRTVVMIITDGEDTGGNGEWTRDRVKGLLKQLDTHQWTALFLGANLDAFSESGNMGIATGTTLPFTNSSTFVSHAYAASASNVLRSRTAVLSGAGYAAATECLSYTNDQRDQTLAVDDQHYAQPTIVTSTTVKE